MTISALVKGDLFRDPEKRTAKSGRTFVTATLKVKTGDQVQWVKLLVFSEDAQTELLRLASGDALSAQGELRVETFEKAGETRVSTTLIANQVLALRRPPSPRAKKGEETQPPDPRTRADGCAGVPVPDLDDSLPF